MKQKYSFKNIYSDLSTEFSTLSGQRHSAMQHLTHLRPLRLQINPGTVGFYRIQYSSAMLESLLPGVRDLSLQPVDRLGLQNDLFSLVRHSQRVILILF